jgi:hypothetical protein
VRQITVDGKEIQGPGIPAKFSDGKRHLIVIRIASS